MSFDRNDTHAIALRNLWCREKYGFADTKYFDSYKRRKNIKRVRVDSV